MVRVISIAFRYCLRLQSLLLVQYVLARVDEMYLDVIVEEEAVLQVITAYTSLVAENQHLPPLDSDGFIKYHQNEMKICEKDHEDPLALVEILKLLTSTTVYI